MPKSAAERLAANKPPRRRRADGARMAQPIIWTCRLREVREGLRLSMRDVGNAIGLSVTGLHQIEHGTDPQLTTARRLADFFGKSIEWLWPERAE
jgi:DNA-binding XRE family transcriptional regulator